MHRFAPIAVFALAACSSPTPPPPPPEIPSKLIVGIQGQPGLASVVSSYRVVATVNGAEAAREVLRPDSTNAGPLPHELALTAPAESPEANVGVSVEAFNVPLASDNDTPEPVLRKLVAATFVRGETKLLRVRLEAQCVTSLVPGFFGPACKAPQSCQAGRCVDGTVLPEDLEPYTPSWSADGPDICKPIGAGPPEIVIGTGQTDYMPLAPNTTLEAERGPQGGHHLWIAVRMRNLKQSGSTTTITGVQPETGLTVPPTSFVFTYDRDEGGYCKIFGLRYQLDNASNPVEKFLGKALDVTVDVKDLAGVKASATVRVNVATTIRG